MAYTPPGGWVETYEDEASTYGRFHARTDCPRIRQPDQLRHVDPLQRQPVPRLR